MSVLIAFLALMIERIAGYPGSVFARIGHPVTWIGALITSLDQSWNREDMTPSARRRAGMAALLAIVAVAVVTGLLAQALLLALPFGLPLAAIAASSLIAQKSLDEHVAAVARALEREGLEGGRREVAMIVGRDPESLDEAGVARAAIESLAENFSDGVVAPVFWLCVAGLPGAAAYKAVNTADSMIGHKSPRHQDFGRAAARCDDMVNLPASRLAAIFLTLAALAVPGASAGGAWRAVTRDARRHRSPNAGWPEAATAGALGLALAGPRRYGGILVEDATMGQGGRREAGAADIRRALVLYRVADAIMIALVASLAVLLSAHFR